VDRDPEANGDIRRRQRSLSRTNPDVLNREPPLARYRVPLDRPSLASSTSRPQRHSPKKLQNASVRRQPVVAVENHHVAGEHRRRVQAEMLQKASHDLVMSANLDQAMFTALSHLKTVLEFDRAHIALLDRSAGTWTPRVSLPRPAKLPADKTLRLADFPLVARVVETKRHQMIDETRETPEWTAARHTPQEIRNWMCLPLIVRDHVIGLLNIDGFEPHRFTAEQFQIAQVFANQTAAAIELFACRSPSRKTAPPP